LNIIEITPLLLSLTLLHRTKKAISRNWVHSETEKR